MILLFSSIGPELQACGQPQRNRRHVGPHLAKPEPQISNKGLQAPQDVSFQSDPAGLLGVRRGDRGNKKVWKRTVK